MDQKKIAELEAATAAAKQAAEEAGGTDEALNKALKDAEAALTQAKEPSHDPIENELNRVKKPKTEAEKAEHVLRSTANRLKELGKDPAAILGTGKPKDDDAGDDDEVPDWYKKEQAKSSERTAVQLADAIEDPKERELVKHALETVVTSGTPEERMKVARGYVNSVKNAQIAEDALRIKNAKRHGSAPGASAKVDDGGDFEPTASEKSMMGPPFNLSKEAILKTREAEAK